MLPGNYLGKARKGGGPPCFLGIIWVKPGRVVDHHTSWELSVKGIRLFSGCTQ